MGKLDRKEKGRAVIRTVEKIIDRMHRPEEADISQATLAFGQAQLGLARKAKEIIEALLKKSRINDEFLARGIVKTAVTLDFPKWLIRIWELNSEDPAVQFEVIQGWIDSAFIWQRFND
jgi:hypothetical protein